MKYEKWSLGYWLFKQYVRFVDWIIHKQVVLTGEENIPKDKPIVITPNHQNALSDPMSILLHTPYQPVWLARADIFQNKFAVYILRFLKIMPVYRIRDGKEQLAKNDKTFADSIKVLENNKALALFPEAAHSSKRQMLPHKKAVPRIVFMAEERAEKNLDIHIVPTGIYYSSYWKFNRGVIVNFGKPIKVNDYLEEYHENPKAAILKLRDRIYDGLEPQVLNIKSKTNYNGFERIRKIYGDAYCKKHSADHSFLGRYRTDRELVKKLDLLEEKQPEETTKLVKLTKTYEKVLRKKGVRSWLVENNKHNFMLLGLNKVGLFLSLPVFLFGFLFNAVPFFTIDTLTRKKIKDHAFWSTFFLVLGMLLFPLFYLLELWAVSSWLPELWMKLLFLVSLPIFGKLAFRWYILLLKTIGRGRLLYMSLFKKAEYAGLKKQQTDLFQQLDHALEGKLA